MVLYKNKYRSDSSRLKIWDYTTPWWYYITICIYQHNKMFGRITRSKIRLNKLGKVAERCWKEIPEHNSLIELDYYVVMPNHLHGILILNGNERRDVACNVSTAENYYSSISPKKNSISTVIRSYKSAVTRRAHKNGNDTFRWQSRDSMTELFVTIESFIISGNTLNKIR